MVQVRAYVMDIRNLSWQVLQKTCAPENILATTWPSNLLKSGAYTAHMAYTLVWPWREDNTCRLRVEATVLPRWRPSLSCCCCSYLEQSAQTRHVRTFYVCFSASSEGFSLQAFIPMTFTATFVVPAQ